MPSTAPHVAVAHDSPGRLRLRLPPATRNPGLIEAVRALPGVTRCQWSPRTGSVLVLYRVEAIAATDILREIASRSPRVATALRAALPLNGARRATSGDISRMLVETFGDLDQKVARLTGGGVRLRLLLPIALVLWAVRDLTRGQVAPLAWSSALWYAHGLFRDYSLPSNGH